MRTFILFYFQLGWDGGERVGGMRRGGERRLGGGRKARKRSLRGRVRRKNLDLGKSERLLLGPSL